MQMGIAWRGIWRSDCFGFPYASFAWWSPCLSRAPERTWAANCCDAGRRRLLNHGEAESAESKEDFIHKLKVCLKELRETLRCLKLIQRVPLVKTPSRLGPLLKENDELIRIFVASLNTTKERMAFTR